MPALASATLPLLVAVVYLLGTIILTTGEILTSTSQADGSCVVVLEAEIGG